MPAGEYRWEEVATCNFCGSADRRLYMESHVPKWYRRQPLKLEECMECGLVRASPRPTLNMLHGDYLAGGPASLRAIKHKMKRPLIRQYHRLEIKRAAKSLGHRPARLFDMGCGAGTTLMEAQALGIEAWGNDINRAGVDMLNAMGCHALHGFSSEIELPSQHFDIVLNFDYLEHSYTPLEDLRRCFEITKPGGILSLKTIYLGCPDHQRFGEHWDMFGAGHFHYFTEDSLPSMVESVGYDIVKILLGNLVFIVAQRPIDPDLRQSRPAPKRRGYTQQVLRTSAARLLRSAKFFVAR